MFHQHNYQIIDKIEFPSSFEVMKKEGIMPDKMSQEMFKKKIVVYFKCETCGHLKWDTHEST